MLRSAHRSAALLLALAAPACAAPAPPAGPGAEPAVRTAPAPAAQPRWGLVVHGGAGGMTPENLPPERQAEYRAALEDALRRGHAVLAEGGSAVDAVTAAITRLEDDPLFNAGRGAVFTLEGRNELDASIMEGRTRNAGAVAGVTRVKNPILLARAVMERSPHVMLAGAGAEAFAAEQGLEMVPPSYFAVPARWESVQRARERAGLPRLPDPADAGAAAPVPFPDDEKFGTVGAVALDRDGNLAAGTSTGGMTGKRWGRIGDSPVIGAGTYADAGCAVSATGHGEFFIRAAVAHDICARARYTGIPVRDAADAVVMGDLVEMGGEGGVIAIDAAGEVSMPFNSSGMFRGHVGPDGEPEVLIFRDEP